MRSEVFRAVEISVVFFRLVTSCRVVTSTSRLLAASIFRVEKDDDRSSLKTIYETAPCRNPEHRLRRKK